MINMYEVNETNKMIEEENLDVRTITLGISLLDCIDSDLQQVNRKVYEKLRDWPDIWWKQEMIFPRSSEFRLSIKEFL